MGSDRRDRSRSRSRERTKRREREERGDRRERSRSRDRQQRKDRKDRTGPGRDKGGGGGGGNANMVPLGKDDGGFGLRNPGVKKEQPDEAAVEKEGINLGLSGALTKDVNTFNGIVIKYSEPPEARIPKRRWRFYQFKGEETFCSSNFLFLVSRRRGDAHPSHPQTVRIPDWKRQKGLRHPRGSPQL